MPATSQATVCTSPPVHVTAVFGCVTKNGPASAVTLTVVDARSTPPPPLRLSSAVRRKVIVRVVVGNDSPIVDVLLNKSDSFGNVRDGLVVARKERKMARVPLSVFGGAAVPWSNSSQS